MCGDYCVFYVFFFFFFQAEDGIRDTSVTGVQTCALPIFLDRQAAWREVVSMAAELGIPVPAFSASLDYFDSYRRDRLPQNLTQAQRDYFGAHTYERVDKEGTFHTEWTKAPAKV